MHIKSQKKNRHDGEDDSPPYFDFSALHMRGLQALMVISGIVGLGIYVPFVAVVSMDTFRLYYHNVVVLNYSKKQVPNTSPYL